MSSIQGFESRARAAERSAVPVFMRVARAVMWFVYALVAVLTVVLVLAFVLRLLGAGTDAAFTRWVYRSGESAMRPFRGIFPTTEVGEVSVLDPSLLFGAVAYLTVALGFDALRHLVDQRLAHRQREMEQARADADSVRLQFETRQQQAEYALAQQQAAQHFAAEEEALRRRAAQTTAAPR